MPLAFRRAIISSLTRGPAGNRTTGNLTADPKTPPYQLDRGGESKRYILSMDTCRNICQALQEHHEHTYQIFSPGRRIIATNFDRLSEKLVVVPSRIV